MVKNLRFVQIGRVCNVNFGPNVNKLVVIVNVVDASRVLIAGVTSGVPRQVMSLHRLSITPIRLSLPRHARIGTLTKAYAAAKVDETWAASSWAKKIKSRELRASATDFDRFKVARAKSTLYHVRSSELSKIQKASAKKGKK